MTRFEPDAFGRMLYDNLKGEHEHEIVERDDGYLDAVTMSYLEPYARWPATERRAMREVRGRVLDIGAGAGRHCLYLQEQGRDVTATDISPLAVRVCRLRGVQRVRQLGILDLVRPANRKRLGRFDTIIMMGNNLGLFGSFPRAQRLLRQFRLLTNPGARIVAATLDPYATRKPVHLDYHRRNLRRGRMGGQIRMRIRYQRLIGPWFDYLLVSRSELRAILAGTGWHLKRTIDDAPGPCYSAVIERD
jgi:SAM-dependent methyltransferase